MRVREIESSWAKPTIGIRAWLRRGEAAKLRGGRRSRGLRHASGRGRNVLRGCRWRRVGADAGAAHGVRRLGGPQHGAHVMLDAATARAPASGVRGRRSSGGSVQRRRARWRRQGEVAGPCVGLCVVANGDTAAVDHVSILQGVICSTECVAGAEEVCVCRRRRRRRRVPTSGVCRRRR